MLQKVDKDRLDKVLEVIKNKKIKFPVATIAKELGRGKSEVSVYLSGKKPMSNVFYKTFIEHFATKETDKFEINDGNTFMRLLKVLEQNADTISSQQKTISLLVEREKPPEIAKNA